MEGARPLVDRDGRSDLEIAIEEIMQDRITLEYDPNASRAGHGRPFERRLSLSDVERRHEPSPTSSRRGSFVAHWTAPGCWWG
jgi:hypothetical protein